MPALEVRSLAGSALLQDLGRDHRASGVPRSGAYDRHAHVAAVGLVGAGPDAATLEIVGQLDVVATHPVTLAVTGRSRVAVGGQPAPSWTAMDVPAGVPVRVTAIGRGYLAVAGGLRAAPVLGSRSTCILGPLGPAPVGTGDVIPLAEDPRSATAGDYCRPSPDTGAIRVVPGPHLTLHAATVQVVESSRIAVRVRPAAPVVATTTLPSLGVLPGTVQVLPSGDWVVLGPDAGTMGGYPVIGVVCSADLDRWAHVQPAEWVALEPIDPASPPEVAEPWIVRVARLTG